MMAGYLANRIMDGTVTYEKVFRTFLYKRYQDDVDQILELEGKGNLITRA